jgi:hypothetical protein
LALGINEDGEIDGRPRRRHVAQTIGLGKLHQDRRSLDGRAHGAFQDVDARALGMLNIDDHVLEMDPSRRLREIERAVQTIRRRRAGPPIGRPGLGVGCDEGRALCFVVHDRCAGVEAEGLAFRETEALLQNRCRRIRGIAPARKLHRVCAVGIPKARYEPALQVEFRRREHEKALRRRASRGFQERGRALFVEVGATQKGRQLRW